MSHQHDLTTVDGLTSYLASRNQRPAKVDLLSGGTANYVYRATTPSGSTCIYKHAAPYLHSDKNFAFDPIRMDYEARALTLVSSLNLSSTPVHAVRILAYNAPAKLLCLSDGGPLALKAAYTSPALHIPDIGRGLAQWLAQLHTSTRSVSLALESPGSTALVPQQSNNPIGVAIYRHAYTHLHTAFALYGYDAALARAVDERYGGLLETDTECLCHGDFWPGNVLLAATLPEELSSEQSSHTLSTTHMTIVDWEMSRIGTSATDVAQFAAEAFLLDAFRTPSHGLLPAFLRAYVTARSGDEMMGRKWVERWVVHFAVHVTYWPTRVVWISDTQGGLGDDEGMRWGNKELVDCGVKLLGDVAAGNWDAVFENELLSKVRNVLEPLLDQ
ncbi:hypothetical protein ACN47E_003373 [Coniothyrium glycines]